MSTWTLEESVLKGRVVYNLSLPQLIVLPPEVEVEGGKSNNHKQVVETC